jgi:HTH-type transcriptional regulator / antitoxin HigA
MMKIQPIKTDQDYKRALKEIDGLSDARPNTTEGDLLELWVILVDAYEAKHHAIPPPDPIEAIKFRMEQLGLSTSDLAEVLGGRNRVSEVLSRKRGLSVNMMRRLHKELHIPADSLLAV